MLLVSAFSMLATTVTAATVAVTVMATDTVRNAICTHTATAALFACTKILEIKKAHRI